MTDNNHPITPPLELVQQWDNDWHRSKIKYDSLSTFVATQAARWGADQELEACCKVLHQHDRAYLLPSQLRAARRPKPPSLAEGALQALNEAVEMSDDSPPEGICANQANIIRTALERLQELERGNE